MTEPTVSDQVVVRAPVDVVYRLVSDVPRMGEWVAECERSAWLGGVTGPATGARFRGYNRRGWHRWSTTATVVAAQPGHLFAFRVTSFGLPVSVWAYDVHATTDGCEVTESMWYEAGWLMRRVLAPLGTGVRDRAGRVAENRRNIARTLGQLKAAAEAVHPAGGQPPAGG
jgi:Polyketide cyclase / dehydrase and lipid transport